MDQRYHHPRKHAHSRAGVPARGADRQLRASDIILGLMLAMTLVVLATLILTSLFVPA